MPITSSRYSRLAGQSNTIDHFIIRGKGNSVYDKLVKGLEPSWFRDLFLFACVAQWLERLAVNKKVAGSIPVASAISKKRKSTREGALTCRCPLVYHGVCSGREFESDSGH